MRITDGMICIWLMNAFTYIVIIFLCIIISTGRTNCSATSLVATKPTVVAPSATVDPPPFQLNCSACFLRAEAKLARIERIKMDLLQKLGFEEPPNATGADFPPILPQLRGLLDKWGFRVDGTALNDDPQSLVSSYYDRMSYQTESTGAQTERVYAIASQPPVFLGLPDNQQISYFKFSGDTINNHVENATLRFYVRSPPESEVVEPVSELVARLYKIERVDGTKMELMHRFFKRDLRTKGHWYEFSVTKLVRHWFKKPELNYGLSLEVEYNGQNLVVAPGSPNADKNMMYMEVMVRDSERTRRKRDAPRLDCHENDIENRCCRYPLQIDFEKFGWDWVIAPKKYVAYYCSGECPFRHLQRYMHTHIVQQANPARSSNVGPCCYPTQMASMPMVYFNSDKQVLVSRVPGMIVSRCGCA